jgi:hypothetical protein
MKVQINQKKQITNNDCIQGIQSNNEEVNMQKKTAASN